MKLTNRILMFTAKNTFKSFVFGPNGKNNTFAYAAALAAAENPGKGYNPLFLHGGAGLGKTHLLHAIGQHVSSNKKDARVPYLSAEQFTTEYTDAIQNNQRAQFHEKYLQIDVLLIDDIQFLVGKQRIQEELFLTFRVLHEAHKQIVMAGNCSPSEIQGLERRLVSRFEWGLVADLRPPDVERHAERLGTRKRVS
jgi:chromosomal replication initiator protein